LLSVVGAAGAAHPPGWRTPEGERPMRGVFNVVMRIVSTLIGLLMVCAGGVWMLQGLDLAFKVGFMVGDKHWVLYGAILALVGLSHIVWTNTRQT
jgi:hypothetical protein